MKELKVPDMHCEMCVARIRKALTAQGIDCTVDLAVKTVAVKQQMAAQAAAVLEELGFTPAE